MYIHAAFYRTYLDEAKHSQGHVLNWSGILSPMVWILEFREVVHASLYCHVSRHTSVRYDQRRTLTLELVLVRRDLPMLAVALLSG